MSQRDMLKEHEWANHPIIGYVPLDKDGNAYQPTLRTRSNPRTKPVTIYSTMARAVTYSPVDAASEVRMFQPIGAPA